MCAAALIKISGAVQGVGFRYFASRSAISLDLCGYIRNAGDGSVITEVEGPRTAVETYIAYLRQGPSLAQVTDIKIKWSTFTGKFGSFTIKD
jgi:acylphosphatase